ncbi:MAG: hypothetical protein H0X40_13280 [Chthoniobacterales bacterium]|nr:hypothetical protein [Chthoniobacterales bacterium]
MKIPRRIFCASLLVVGFSRSFAGNSDVEIHSVPKRIDQTIAKASEGGANLTREHWTYEITVENKTFHDLTGVQAKYVILYTHEQLGVKASATPKRANGTFEILQLKPHEKKTFTTKPVELEKSNLVGNWIYTSGAKPGAQDALVGIALHLEQSGQEFANPSTLSREKVE